MKQYNKVKKPLIHLGRVKAVDMNSNIKYKDSVFSLYMSEPARLIEVYNAIQDTQYPPDTPVEINTLEDVLYKARINDISFTLDGKFVILVEHQSTINENMPVRMLLYLGRLYEKLLDEKNIYRRKRIPLEAPEFLVLYNGKENFPEQQILRLSDAFLAKPHQNSIELTVKVLNTNYGHNQPILNKSKALKDYSIFISKVQAYRSAGHELSEAIRLAVLFCQEHDVMQPFLLNHASEVVNMLMTEWKLEEAIAVEREEGLEEGLKKGLEQGLEKGLEKGLEQGLEKGEKKAKKEIIQAMLQTMSISQAANILKMTTEQIESIVNDS